MLVGFVVVVGMCILLYNDLFVILEELLCNISVVVIWVVFSGWVLVLEECLMVE